MPERPLVTVMYVSICVYWGTVLSSCMCPYMCISPFLFLHRPSGWESPLSSFPGFLVFETLDKPSGVSNTASCFLWPSGEREE